MRRVVWVLLFAAAGLPSSASGGANLCSPALIRGTVTGDDQNAYLLHRFTVGAGTKEILAETKLTQPQGARDPFQYTLDMGIREPSAQLGEGRFRSWNHNPARIRPDDRGTASSIPGELPPGEWTVELGAAATIDGFPASYEVTITCTSDPEPPLGPPFSKPPFDPGAVVRPGPGWFSGDTHVHSRYSFDAPATPDQVAAEARRVGLDFVARSDHNTSAQWLWLGEEQARHPDVLFLRSREVTTYFGHYNTHGTTAFPDYRTGPTLDADNGKRLVRGHLDVNESFDLVRAGGGLVQINHPAFPPDPVAPFICRGCGWDYPFADYRVVDLIEIQTGPPGKSVNNSGLPDVPEPVGTVPVGGNPFTPQAIAMWERLLDLGHLVGAVGGSDDHRAGRASEGLTSAYLGQPTTVVYAGELSENAIVDALRKRHTYVKFWGPDDPDLRLEAVSLFEPEPERVMMGDVLPAAAAMFSARVIGGEGTILQFVADGAVVAAVPVTSGDFSFDLPWAGPGWLRIQLADATRPYVTVSNPIFLRP